MNFKNDFRYFNELISKIRYTHKRMICFFHTSSFIIYKKTFNDFGFGGSYMSSKNKFIITFLVFMLVASLFVFTAAIEYNRSYQNQVKETEDSLFNINSNIENLITSRMIAANGLKSHIEVHPDFSQSEFNRFAKGIFDLSNDVVLRMSFLTDTTITHTYPFDEYSSIIGTDLESHEDKKDWVNKAKSDLKSIITAPVNIVDGGVGIVVRVPVEREGKYFGQVSIVFDYLKTLESSGLIGLSESHYVKLDKIDEFSAQEKDVWNNFTQNDKDSKEYVTSQVNLYDSEMTLTAIPKNGFNGKSNLFYFILAIGGLTAIVSSFVIYKLLATALALTSSEKELKENNEELEAMVNQLIANEEELHSQYDEINKQKEHIQFLADRDYLTNLYNRRKFTEDITEHISKKGSGTIVLFDIDNFKNINDTQGHLYGDRVLNHIAYVLKDSLIIDSIVYRTGGDEFAVHLPGIVDNNEIESSLKSFFDDLKSNNYIEHMKNHLTASVGIAKYPQDSSSADDILMKSDIAMYKAKEEGKNRFCYFSEDLTSSLDNNVKIERELQNAVEMSNFKLVYQPVINSISGEISYFEALIRMKDSNLSPGEFIPVAENSGLIITIGNWVVDEVCRQLSFWREHHMSIKPVAINISAKQLYDGSIVEYITESLKKYDLSPQFLEIEITESVLIENSAHTIMLLNKLREMGIAISLDDFGTGYSSLSYLTYMPVDKVKIDKSLKDKFLFLENVAVMKGIISICHGLNLQVVTEGVETSEEFIQLRTYGSDFVQGFYLERPLSPERAIKLIETNYFYDNEK